MQKWMGCALVLLLLSPALLLAQEEGMTVWECSPGYEGQTLHVANWPLYLAEDTLSNFEESCGVTLNYEVYISNEILLTILREGNSGYDVVVPTGYAVTTMIPGWSVAVTGSHKDPQHGKRAERFAGS